MDATPHHVGPLLLASLALLGCPGGASAPPRDAVEARRDVDPARDLRGADRLAADRGGRDGPRHDAAGRDRGIDAGPATWGWDYNLTHRCVTSPGATGSTNFHQDLADCPTAGRRWTIAVQSEQTLGASCPGPVNQSLPINPVGSAILALGWAPHVDELGRKNWSVNLKTDLSANAHPCGAGHFTWYVLLDHVGHGGGPFPRPDRVVSSATISVNDFTPQGATRFIVGWQGYWDGKARAIELTVQGANWGDAHPDPDVVNIIDNAQLQFIHLDGKGLAAPLVVPRGVDTKLVVPWHQIVQNLVQRKLLAAPSGGWAATATTAIFLGHETNNWQAAGSAIADLWVTNLRVESL